jgi:hypothetical protein
MPERYTGTGGLAPPSSSIKPTRAAMAPATCFENGSIAGRDMRRDLPEAVDEERGLLGQKPPQEGEGHRPRVLGGAQIGAVLLPLGTQESVTGPREDMRLVRLPVLSHRCLGGVDRRESDPPGAQIEMPTGRPNWCIAPCTIGVKHSGRPPAYTAVIVGREKLDAELIPASEWGAGLGTLIFFETITLLVPGVLDLMSNGSYTYPTKVKIVLPPDGPPRVTVQRAL